jgi:hypothetical protein
MHQAPAALDPALRGEAAAPLTGALERGEGLQETVADLWDTSFDDAGARQTGASAGRPAYPVGQPAHGVLAERTIEAGIVVSHSSRRLRCGKCLEIRPAAGFLAERMDGNEVAKISIRQRGSSRGSSGPAAAAFPCPPNFPGAAAYKEKKRSLRTTGG